MLCAVCQGACSILTFKGGMQWWQCPGCGGTGVHAQHGAPTFRQMRKDRP
jgi:hypothetical protein